LAVELQSCEMHASRDRTREIAGNGRKRRPGLFHGQAVLYSQDRTRFGTTCGPGPGGTAAREAPTVVARATGKDPAVFAVIRPCRGGGWSGCGGSRRLADAQVVGCRAIAWGRHHGASGAGGVWGAMVGGTRAGGWVAAELRAGVRAVPVSRTRALLGGCRGALAVAGAGVGRGRVQGRGDRLVPGAAVGGGVPGPVVRARAPGRRVVRGAGAVCVCPPRSAGWGSRGPSTSGWRHTSSAPSRPCWRSGGCCGWQSTRSHGGSCSLPRRWRLP
jgi:hypothetical protein